MKACEGVDVEIHIFLTSALVGRERSVLPPGETAPRIHWKGDLVRPRVCLDDVDKRKFFSLPGLDLQPLSRPST
jgi:hypothetical protein